LHHHGHGIFLCCKHNFGAKWKEDSFWEAPWLNGWKLKDIALQTLLRQINLNNDVMDDITWTLTEDGKYTIKSAYKAHSLVQLLRPILLGLEGPPQLKNKFVVMASNSNRLFISDRLEKLGWPDCGVCPPLQASSDIGLPSLCPL
jgi:hypothetical protein